MINRLLLLLVVGILGACNNPAKVAQCRLNSLQGNWETSGSIQVHQKWIIKADTSCWEGQLFSLNNTDTNYLEEYRIFSRRDTFYFVPDINNQQPLILIKANNNKLIFENTTRAYPNRVIFRWDNDSTYSFRKENSRGNQSIEFVMTQNN